MDIFKKLFLNILLLYDFTTAVSQNIISVNDTPTVLDNSSVILSRKKRFLIFPEGSSVQLVFCLTYPTIFTIGDIFLVGNTAALAWELPQDPYSPFRHHADPLHRRGDSKYYAEDLFKNKRKFIPNPAFAKRSVNGPSKSEPVSRDELKKSNGLPEIDHRMMHASQQKREFLKFIDQADLNFHRSGRVGLYEKIEAVLQALGSDGRQCVLKTLCRIGQSQDVSQGSFIEEILRAVFTLPQGPEFKADHHNEYDTAHLTTESCENLYPGCDNLIFDPTEPKFSY